ncbi:MAG TPA: type IV toxin-antitoxin system AbiEi family antitoxin domain-containing protein [Armatimonadota bacterium]
MRQRGLVRARDAREWGVASQELARLEKEGRLIRVGRGVYSHPEDIDWSVADLAVACQRVPNGVICLLSALRFHDIGTQNPLGIWIAVPRGAWRPVAGEERLHVVQLSGVGYQAGIEAHGTGAGEIRVYSAAKTIADCWKWRGKLGMETALEALRDALQQNKATASDILRYASVDRVANVMRPYLEALA